LTLGLAGQVAVVTGASRGADLVIDGGLVQTV
jgi:hypothetical protein